MESSERAIRLAGVFDDSDLYNEAVRLVLATGAAPPIYLQRKLRIGFSQAMRLIDVMEAEGIIGPLKDGNREVNRKSDAPQ